MVTALQLLPSVHMFSQVGQNSVAVVATLVRVGFVTWGDAEIAWLLMVQYLKS